MASTIDFFGATTEPGEKANLFLEVCDRAMQGSYYSSDEKFSDLAYVSSYGTVTLEAEHFFEYCDDGSIYENAVMEFIEKYPGEDFCGYYAVIDTSCGGLDYYSYTYHDGVLRIEHRYPRDEEDYDEEDCDFGFLSISKIQEICHAALDLNLARKCGVSGNYESWELVNGKWKRKESLKF